nr:MAG TPA: hypothetical protein [Caudoviricetes sp.]
MCADLYRRAYAFLSLFSWLYNSIYFLTCQYIVFQF